MEKRELEFKLSETEEKLKNRNNEIEQMNSRNAESIKQLKNSFQVWMNEMTAK
jgi:deoxyadenosine/deoxycytidine kinase